MKKLLILPILLMFATCSHGYSYLEAKQILGKIYSEADSDNLTTLYCGCRMKSDGKGKLTPNDLKSCGYKIRDDQERASRIEWEHVVPAYRLGGQMNCWHEGGRDTCRENPAFSRMEGDMHNLFPVIGEINKDRSNYSFTVWDSSAKSGDVKDESEESQIIKIIKLIFNFIVELLRSMGNPEDAATVEMYGNKAINFIEDIIKTRQNENSQQEKTRQKEASDDQEQNGIYTYGKCEILIDSRNRLAQPPERSRGTIARAYLYMSEAYGIPLDKKESKLFSEWSQVYPADAWECRRNKLIAVQQGNDNPYITKQCRGRLP
jgi:endonuclease I